MVPSKPISCPKALQKEQKLLKAGEMHYAETLVFHFGSGGNSPTALASSIPVVPRNLKDRRSFLMNEESKIALSFLLSVVQQLLHLSVHELDAAYKPSQLQQ